ncbi:adenosine receptor A3-like [Diadema antillarum]|uniref:adenosine receptor A3-like n=1 Tax=Diadema antillarum TaxID=105358 RepID=UPI003A88A2F1
MATLARFSLPFTSSGGNTTADAIQIQELVKACCFIAVGLIAVVGNIFVIFMVAVSRKLHTITNIFVINLSIADLLIGLLFPLQSLWILHLEDALSLPAWACTTIGALIIIAIGCSVSTLAFIAFNRYILIARSRVVYQRVFTPLNITLMVSSTWLNLTGFLIIPQAVGYGSLGYDTYLELCAWDPAHEYDVIYKSGALAFLTIPLLLSSLCYWLLFRYVKNHLSNLAAHRQNAPPVASTRRIDIVITKNLLLVICTFYVCILPFVIAYCATGFVANPLQYGQMAAYLAILLGVNSCLNPLFYCLKHPHFREVFGFVIRCQLSKVPLPSRILKSVLTKPDRRGGLTDTTTWNARTETNIS